MARAETAPLHRRVTRMRSWTIAVPDKLRIFGRLAATCEETCCTTLAMGGGAAACAIEMH
jgi:hypothetical protein